MPWSKIKPDTDELNYCHNGNCGGRQISYAQAVNEGLRQSLTLDERVFVMGQGVDDPSGMFGTTRGLQEEFGKKRVFDTPLAETALTGVANGAAIGGMRPVYFHNRPDFLLLAMDQLVNHASKWHFMFGGAVNVPLVLWACIGRGWGSAAQHSQALQGIFFHVPGLKLLMPSTCYDAKGLLLAAIKDDNPVLILDHRYNFKQKGMVPEDMYTVPIGKGIVRRPGRDVTIVAISHLVADAFMTAEKLAGQGVDVEVIDPRTLRPLDEALILNSVMKTGRLVIADTGWKTGGVTAEIAALVSSKAFRFLKAPIERVACPDLPTPAGYTLEDAYYIGQSDIKHAVMKTIDFER
ncbi:alpha-ketoacid dehydrogenase subunit beta [Desulfotignum phosphitoxidans]|uniref:CDP-6-deoxy-D-xylo-4-hexulose-3-dehydrase RfbH n=1 Tax=Desulfotignum phosphitoxidans DSM 13687 TaxID=1286635 RepID=S0G7G0_9BACT|nr:alpha-ketoacid dehydrogenase subunit beta [Desulfotignum phosphitoxidans]EMS80866.1 CDP-6-deoxy-D-xylo-4-hexulose-3-dehydrase RfbH [Desulfotignum phosphitoxidans DSM 13687]